MEWVQENRRSAAWNKAPSFNLVPGNINEHVGYTTLLLLVYYAVWQASGNLRP
jgi:hypothetical protein